MDRNSRLTEGAQRILRIAAPLFAAKGFTGVSITDIAAAAGTSKANIFHHFPNKRSLYLAAIGMACEAFRNEFGKLSKDTDDHRRLRTIALRHLGRMLADPDSVRLILREAFAGEKGQDRTQVAGILHQNFALLVAAVAEEQARGGVRREIDPAMVALTIIALNSFLFQGWAILERFEEFSQFESAQQCLDALFGHLGTGLMP